MSTPAPLWRSTSALSLGPGLGRHPDRAATLGTATRRSMPPARTLPETLAHWARTLPTVPLFYFLSMDEQLTTLTAEEMLLHARRLAAGLRARGVRAGDRVVLSFDTSPEFLETFFACGLAGAVPCLVDLPSSKVSLDAWSERLRGKVVLLGARAMVIDGEFAPQAREALAATRVEAEDGDGQVQVVPVHDLLDSGELREAAACHEDETAFIQFTSGTTAFPKGVQISHRALMANIHAMGERVEWRTDDLMVGWLPLFHDMGLVATTLAAFVHGMPTVLMPPMAFLLKPARWLWAVHYFRGTASFAPNFAYQFCAKRIKDAELSGLDLSSWRRALNAAEFIHADTLRQFTERFERHGFDPQDFHPAYGMAEMTVGISIRHADEPLVVETISRSHLASRRQAVVVAADSPDAMPVVGVGRIFPGHDVRIVNESGHDVGERHEGEIVLRGPSMFQGYYRNPEATAQVLRDGWVWTGDLGYLADGQLFICGRNKDLIIKAGENYHPYLMEISAAKVAGVRPGCVAAVGVDNPQTGTEDIVIVFETAETNPNALRQLCRLVEEQVFMGVGIRPNRVVPILPQTLPKTSSGKIRRAQVRERVLSLESFSPVPVAKKPGTVVH